MAKHRFPSHEALSSTPAVGMVVHTCEPSTQEVGTAGSGVQEQLRLHREFEDSLRCKRPYFRNNQQTRSYSPNPLKAMPFIDWVLKQKDNENHKITFAQITWRKFLSHLKICPRTVVKSKCDICGSSCIGSIKTFQL